VQNNSAHRQADRVLFDRRNLLPGGADSCSLTVTTGDLWQVFPSGAAIALAAPLVCVADIRINGLTAERVLALACLPRPDSGDPTGSVRGTCGWSSCPQPAP